VKVAQPAHRRREDAAMIHRHGLAERGRGGIGRVPAIAPCLRHQPGLVEQLIPLEHALLVPARGRLAEGGAHALIPARALARTARARRPGGELWLDHLRHHRGPSAPTVFPGEIAVPVLPLSAASAARRGFARQGEIADRDHSGRWIERAAFAAEIRERIELLHITERNAGLLAHPGAKTQLEGPMARGIERPGRQSGKPLGPSLLRLATAQRLARAVNGEHARFASGHRDHHGAQTDDDVNVALL
jgi:hypothetical protein